MVQFTFFDKNGGFVFKTLWFHDAYSESELYYYLDNLCVMYDEVSAVSVRTDYHKEILLREEIAEIAEACCAFANEQEQVSGGPSTSDWEKVLRQDSKKINLGDLFRPYLQRAR